MRAQRVGPSTSGPRPPRQSGHPPEASDAAADPQPDSGARPRRARSRGTRPQEQVLDDLLKIVLDERRSEWSRAALSDGEATRLAEDLGRYLREGSLPGDVTHTGAEKSLIRRFIDIARRELLSADRGLAAADTLALVRRLEDARARFEATWHQVLSSGLHGANARDMVVELAHDLRSPLTSVMFLSETLRKGQSGEINETQRKQLGIIYSAALGLATMANDLMDLASDRNDANIQHLDNAPFALSELVESVRQMVLPMIEEKRLDFSFYTPAHDIRIGKSVPLGRILLNLVTNAIKFTETGRIEMTARETTGNKVEISVRDTGRGMDEEGMNRIMQPFQRSESSTGFHFSGTALGLSISRRLVEVVGGELRVESKLGQGTRFYFEIELPRASRV